jgi:hypothetical protein
MQEFEMDEKTTNQPTLWLQLKAAPSRPKFWKGVVPAAAAFASIEFAGVMVTDWFERTFHETRIFAGWPSLTVPLICSLSILAISSKKLKPRLIEWAIPFCLPIVGLGALGLLSAPLMATPDVVEMQWFLLASFCACCAVVGLPITVASFKFVRDNRTTLGEAMGFGDGSLNTTSEFDAHTLLRASEDQDLNVEQMLRPATAHQDESQQLNSNM